MEIQYAIEVQWRHISGATGIAKLLEGTVTGHANPPPECGATIGPLVAYSDADGWFWDVAQAVVTEVHSDGRFRAAVAGEFRPVAPAGPVPG